jgi:hypothetical protein
MNYSELYNHWTHIIFPFHLKYQSNDLIAHAIIILSIDKRESANSELYYYLVHLSRGFLRQGPKAFSGPDLTTQLERHLHCARKRS